MVDESVKHEPLMRWWTFGQFEPCQVELLEYLGDDTWSSQELGNGDVADVCDRDLYWNEADALRAYLEWLENVHLFVGLHGADGDSSVMQELATRIAIANSKLDKGR